MRLGAFVADRQRPATAASTASAASAGAPTGREPYVPQQQLERIVEQVYGGLKLSETQENQLTAALERELTDEVSFSVEKAAMARRRPAHAQHERQKVLQGRFRSRTSPRSVQARTDSYRQGNRQRPGGGRRAESTDSPHRGMLETALSYMRDAHSGYAKRIPICSGSGIGP